MAIGAHERSCWGQLHFTPVRVLICSLCTEQKQQVGDVTLQNGAEAGETP